VIPANNAFTEILFHFIRIEEYCNISFIKWAYHELYQFLKDCLVVHTALLSRDTRVSKKVKAIFKLRVITVQCCEMNLNQQFARKVEECCSNKSYCITTTHVLIQQQRQ
jgi:hypothetical protein